MRVALVQCCDENLQCCDENLQLELVKKIIKKIVSKYHNPIKEKMESGENSAQTTCLLTAVIDTSLACSSLRKTLILCLTHGNSSSQSAAYSAMCTLSGASRKTGTIGPKASKKRHSISATRITRLSAAKLYK